MYQLFTYGVCARLSKACAIVLTLAAPAAAEELEILALGDSLIQGYGLMAMRGLCRRCRIGWRRKAMM